ncbi:carboxypeptidase-like regulatory domain-containing protein [Marinifilum flexuosum]|uniref:carboxypeptidase-like regulatory domain-containing protein n=1 Tax=Marinifilum flexuosum TaxID=1117708 RepID=UPI00248F6DEC|nr:carboxypeptidase-like regulatory domain-containing protein [Marinifilum flexuosum]
MSNKLFICLALMLLCNHAYMQNIQIIKGQITCSNDTIAIPYAHIGIMGTGIGTVSNINGDFELKGQFNLEKDTLMISHIEYEKKLIPLSELVSDTNFIKLARNEYLLADVIVLPDNKKKEIFKNVIENLKNNYPDKLYQCEAFYREIQYQERTKKHTRLIESAVNIQDGKVTGPLSKIKCSLLQFRKSDNFTEEHLGSKLFKKMFNFSPNYLHHLLVRNPIRYYRDRLHTSKFNPLTQKYKGKELEFALSHVIKKSDDKIYVFKTTKGFYCTIYINSKDYAILKYEEEMKGKTSLIYKNSYHYKKIDNKYYPAFFYSASVTDYLKNSKGLGITESSLTFVNYSPDRKKFKRLRSKHVLPNELDLYEQEMEYDEIFWANYNILLDEPLEDKIITDLERKTSLQSQFKENATN